jgi:hypothetical protein
VTVIGHAATIAAGGGLRPQAIQRAFTRITPTSADGIETIYLPA